MHTDKITRDRPTHLLNRWKDATHEITKQLNVQKTSNGWTSDNEKFLQRISEEVQSKIWICENSMSFYGYASKFTNWLIFILSTVCTIVTSIWALNHNSESCDGGSGNGWESIFVISAGGLIAVMSSGIELSGWNTKSQHFVEPLQDWRRLNWLVGYKITSKRKNRGNADELLKELLDSIFAIESTTPEAPSFIKSKYKKRFSNYGLFKNESGKFEIAHEESPAKKPESVSEGLSGNYHEHTIDIPPRPMERGSTTIFQQQFPKCDESSSDDDDEYYHQTNEKNLAFQLQRMGDILEQTISEVRKDDDDEDEDDDVVIAVGDVSAK